MRALYLLPAVALVSPSLAADAKMAGLLLYQPERQMRSRVGDVGAFASFVQKAQTACAGAFTAEAREGVEVVVMLKPGGGARVWFVSSLAQPPDRSQLAAAIAALPAPPVRAPVAFALAYDLNGFVRPAPSSGQLSPPIPAEWTERTKGVDGPLVAPDGFIPYVWPDEKKP